MLLPTKKFGGFLETAKKLSEFHLNLKVFANEILTCNPSTLLDSIH